MDWLLQYAFEQRASDIHLEPRRDEGYVRFRIDGVLHRVYQVPTNVMIAIVGRIKILGGMDIAEKRRPLDGRLKTRTPEGSEVELRLSTVPTALGEKLVHSYVAMVNVSNEASRKLLDEIGESVGGKRSKGRK